MLRWIEKFNVLHMWRQISTMEAAHMQYFATYLAQGVGRVSKEYLKGSAATVLADSKSSMQLFHNLLPEFGSLPWTLKPLLVLLVEQTCTERGQRLLMAAIALGTGIVWMCITSFELGELLFLFCTGMVSLGSALVDGLVDGRVSAESVDAESAARLQYLCQSGNTIGALYIGLIAWSFSLSKSSSLLLTACTWASIAPLALIGSASSQSQKSEKSPSQARTDIFSTLSRLTNSTVILVAFLSFMVCLSPSVDTFFFRKQVLGVADSQQPLISVAGTFGWFMGTSLYKTKLSSGRTPEDSLRVCMLLWPLSSIITMLYVAAAQPGPLILLLSALEKAACEFGKAMTFMPTTVLQQLHAPSGCEGTAFTMMQAGGTVGMILGRNLEWSFMNWFMVDPQLGSAGFANYLNVAFMALVWRCLTMLLGVLLIVPLLRASSFKSRQR
eukprot:TRINITY_DN55592_c0_g1_i1.p1 TRINITY_DN55592_c0_g1~~TRINITY_DN55592_c0_g1_i1.p1  ORF type:complete len:442 (+),score=34.14 TRINITY_DN55592_c0_g1_i1:43-1368(+)